MPNKENVEPQESGSSAVRRPLPTGRELIKLAREYVDIDYDYMGSDSPGVDYEILDQKNFLKIVKWLKEKGF